MLNEVILWLCGSAAQTCAAGCNCRAYTNAKVSGVSSVRQDTTAKMHKGCGRECDCYSQIKHQIVETLLWYAVMESYCRGDCNKNTNRREKGRRQKEKQSQTGRDELLRRGEFSLRTILLHRLKVQSSGERSCGVWCTTTWWGGSWCWHVTCSESLTTAALNINPVIICTIWE